jgi:hypothetical protein
MNPLNRHHASGGPSIPHHHDMMYDTRKRQADMMSPMGSGGVRGGGGDMNPNKKIRKNW